MSEPSVVGPVQEYQALRSELLDSRKYVFERPLLILTLGVAGMTALHGEYRALLPPFILSLVIFNFWFSVNRLLSAARIVAYIQLALEEGRATRWFGWETCLREYRRWTQRESREKLIDDALDRDTVPDALTYYAPIYMLHVGVVVFALIASLAAVRFGSWLSVICLATSALFGVAFARIAVRYRPAHMRTVVERNRAVWVHVLEAMSSKPGPEAPAGGAAS